MTPSHGALVVFGSGPGVGSRTAALFAERGFQKVIVMSRNAARLSEDADFVRSASAGVEVHEIPVDMGKPEYVQESLKKVDEALSDTPLEFVLFNAARLGKSEFFSFDVAAFGNDLNIAVVGLYAVAQWAMPKLQHTASTFDATTPALLVTSGMLAKDPFPAMFSLAAGKAGQYSLTQSLHKEFEPKGVHVGLIIIAGTVADKSEVTNARNIADAIWTAFTQPRTKGKLEVTLEDPAYLEHIKNREKRDK